MNAPLIQPITDALTAVPSVHPSLRLFTVLRDGTFAGRRWHAGDVVACRNAIEPRGPIVLEARGHGRPRLGMLEGHALRGDGGEACSPLRWGVAGEVVAVLHREEATPERAQSGEVVKGMEGWRAVALVEGALGALVDGGDEAGVAQRVGARAPRSEAVPLRVVHRAVTQPSGGRVRHGVAWATRGQLSLFAAPLAA